MVQAPGYPCACAGLRRAARGRAEPGSLSPRQRGGHRRRHRAAGAGSRAGGGGAGEEEEKEEERDEIQAVTQQQQPLPRRWLRWGCPSVPARLPGAGSAAGRAGAPRAAAGGAGPAPHGSRRGHGGAGRQQQQQEEVEEKEEEEGAAGVGREEGARSGASRRRGGSAGDITTGAAERVGKWLLRGTRGPPWEKRGCDRGARGVSRGEDPRRSVGEAALWRTLYPKRRSKAVSWRRKGLGNDNETHPDKVTRALTRCGAAPCPRWRRLAAAGCGRDGAEGPARKATGLSTAAPAGTLALQETATRCGQCQPRALPSPPGRGWCCSIKILPCAGR